MKGNERTVENYKVGIKDCLGDPFDPLTPRATLGQGVFRYRWNPRQLPWMRVVRTDQQTGASTLKEVLRLRQTDCILTNAADLV